MRVSLDPDDWSPRKRQPAQELVALTHGDQFLAQRLRAKLTERIQAQSIAVVGGAPATLELYRQAVGELKGLRDALACLEEAEREMSGADSAKPKGTPLYES